MPEPNRNGLGPGTKNTVDILCRLDPVRKLEAGLEHLPGLRLKPRPLDGTADSPSTTVVVELVLPHFREVPGLLPYLVLLAHDCAREPHQRARGGEHLQDTRPAFYLPVGPLLHVVGAQALPARRREVEVCQGVRLSLLEDCLLMFTKKWSE